MADVVVLTTVPLDSVLEAVSVTRRNNLYLTGIVFFLSIMIVLWYARLGISRHLRKLTAAAEEIKKGNFDTNWTFLMYLQDLQIRLLQKRLPVKKSTLSRT